VYVLQHFIMHIGVPSVNDDVRSFFTAAHNHMHNIIVKAAIPNNQKGFGLKVKSVASYDG